VVSSDPLIFQIELARKMAERLATRVRTTIGSETLRRALETRVVVLPSGEIGADLFIPHYWAIYYHDGRGPVRPVNGKFLVYFARIEDDPRVAGGRDYPVRAAQIRRLRLDPAEFRRLVQEGKLIVTQRVGPAKGRPFFERLKDKAPAIVQATVNREFRGHVKAALADVLKITVSLRLR
jgi:hypothetical protein